MEKQMVTDHCNSQELVGQQHSEFLRVLKETGKQEWGLHMHIHEAVPQAQMEQPKRQLLPKQPLPAWL